MGADHCCRSVFTEWQGSSEILLLSIRASNQKLTSRFEYNVEDKSKLENATLAYKRLTIKTLVNTLLINFDKSELDFLIPLAGQLPWHVLFRLLCILVPWNFTVREPEQAKYNRQSDIWRGEQ